jgi:exonuclease VII small subunit
MDRHHTMIPTAKARPRTPALLALLAVLLAAVPAAAQGNAAAEAYLRRTVDVERRLVLEDLAAFERARSAETEARTALDEALTLLRSVAGGTVAGSGAAVNNLERLELRLETAAAELAVAAERSSRALARLEERLQRLRLLAELTVAAPQAAVADVLSGSWRVTVQPGGTAGVFELSQDGTIVSGTYRFADGRRGSLRGTFVDGRLRLERVDVERGFDAIFEGVVGAGAQGVAGEWTATELAEGDVSGGEWTAVKAGGGA